jgi:hypothetical protein
VAIGLTMPRVVAAIGTSATILAVFPALSGALMLATGNPAVPKFESLNRLAVLAIVAVSAAACSSNLTTTISQPLSATADAPYEKILVVTLFDSFDARRYLESEIVAELARQGAVGVASTKMMNSRTPLVAQTFIDMVDDIGADAVLLTQLTALNTEISEKDARPEATYNYWPTYYYNVFAVQLTEYVEPPRLNVRNDLVLATQVYSVESEEPVWGMESRSQFVEVQEDGIDYQVFVDEAAAIVRRMSRSGIFSRTR